jgi:hypothetical protein
MYLLIEYYKSQNQRRDSEFLLCIKHNINNPILKKIYVFISDDSVLDIDDEKLEVIKNSSRPTFLDLFRFCNENLTNEICVVANTDIIFDESLKYIIDFELESIFLALTRWDLVPDGDNWMIRFYDFPWRHPNDTITTGYFSQDAWIFKPKMVLDDRLNFLMGKPGCDNRVSQIVHENGYDVRNPSKQIIIKHLHQSNHRTYTDMDIVPGPYLLIKPSDNIIIKPEIKTIPHF